jgi:tetratricopeptide (TPR) repeat protein
VRAAAAGVDEALAAFKAGHYLEASAAIQEVVDQSPGYAYGYFLLGHCMLKMNAVVDAERNFDLALANDPTRAEYYQGFALALNAAGNWRLSVRVTTDGMARARDQRVRHALLALRGVAWGNLRRWGDAANDLDAARRIRVEPWVLLYLGKARFATGAFADAVEPLQKALGLAPEDPAAIRLLAECYLRIAAAEPDPIKKRFNYTAALSYAQRLTPVSPNDLDALQLLGRTALGAGDLARAESVFRHVLNADPRQCYALANLGRTYMAASRWGDAEIYLHKALVCAPRLATAYESLGELYVETGRPDEAASAYRRAEAIEPKRPARELPPTLSVIAPR